MPIQVTGLSPNVRLDTTGLDKIIQESPGKFARVVGETAYRILKDARMITPRDPKRPPKVDRKVSGALRANSDVVKQDDIGLVWNVEYYQDYATYQELGAPAINLPARPFLTPSVEAADAQFQADLAKVLNE